MRARSLKPQLFKNELLGTADPLLTLLFEGLWCLADRQGLLEDRPLRIKAEVFPYRDGIDTEKLLVWLTNNEFIRRYEVDGLRVIWVIRFHAHQSPHHNEKESELPLCPEACTPKIKSAFAQGTKSVIPRQEALRSDSLLSDSPSLTPDSRSVRAGPGRDLPGENKSAMPTNRSLHPRNGKAGEESIAVKRVFEHWQEVHGKPKAQLDEKRIRTVRHALNKYGVEDLCKAISGYKNSPHHMGTDPKGNGTKYNDIELLLRDAKHVEVGLEFANLPPQPIGAPLSAQEVERRSAIDREWQQLHTEASRFGFRMRLGAESPDEFRTALSRFRTTLQQGAAQKLAAGPDQGAGTRLRIVDALKAMP